MEAEEQNKIRTEIDRLVHLLNAARQREDWLKMAKAANDIRTQASIIGVFTFGTSSNDACPRCGDRFKVGPYSCVECAFNTGDEVYVTGGVHIGRSGKIADGDGGYFVEVAPNEFGVPGLNPRANMVVGTSEISKTKPSNWEEIKK